MHTYPSFSTLQLPKTNRVTQVIHEVARFVQGSPDVDDDVFSRFQGITSAGAFKNAHAVKSAKHVAPILQSQPQSNVASANTQTPMQHEQIPPPPPPPLPLDTNQSPDQANESSHTNIQVPTPASLMYALMFVIDPMISLYTGRDLTSRIAAFTDTMCKELHTKNYFKNLGFSRKRSLTLDDMISHIRDTTFDVSRDIFTITYFAKLHASTMNTIFIDAVHMTSEIITFVDDSKDKNLACIVKRTNGYTSSTHEDVKNASDISKFIKSTFLIALPQTPHKITQLRKIAKFYQIPVQSTMTCEDVLSKIETI